jgi:probable F420-dependent oxidoreductase
MGAMTLAEATRGRFVLGLGVSHAHLAARLRGHQYDKPLTRMREYLGAYRRAIYKGPGQDEVAEPPILLAALRERMLELAATEADGAFPYLVSAKRVAWMRQRLDANAAGDRRPLLAVTLPVVVDPDAGRAADAARAYIAPYLRTPNYRASWTEQGFSEADWSSGPSDRLLDAMVARGGARQIRPRIDELHAAGADHVALIPLDALGVSEDLPALEALRPG